MDEMRILKIREKLEKSSGSPSHHAVSQTTTTTTKPVISVHKVRQVNHRIVFFLLFPTEHKQCFRFHLSRYGVRGIIS